MYCYFILILSEGQKIPLEEEVQPKYHMLPRRHCISINTTQFHCDSTLKMLVPRHFQKGNITTD